jgi:hypothetical protein
VAAKKAAILKIVLGAIIVLVAEFVALFARNILIVAVDINELCITACASPANVQRKSVGTND